MNNIEMILKSAAPAAVDPGPEIIDADLARGRAALINTRRRQTLRRTSAGAVTLAVAGAAVVAIVATSGARNHVASPPASRAGIHAKSTAPAVRPATIKAKPKPQTELVAYTGAQLPGFTVSQIPQGWHLSTSTSTALLITPDGSSNNDPDVFENKLAVLTSSVDQHGLGSGDPVTVDGKPGRVSHQSGTLMLTYNSANGFGVVIQAPSTLGWTDTQIVEFAQAVKVTANAVHARG